MNIRKATLLDSYGIFEVYKEWIEFKGILPDDLIALEDENSISENISSKNRIYLVAEINEKIVGACYIDTQDHSLSCIRLGDMIVKKLYRKKGVGLALVEYVKKYAKDNNVHKIWLWTQSELTSAISLYEKCGFKMEGVQKGQFCSKDALLFGLELD